METTRYGKVRREAAAISLACGVLGAFSAGSALAFRFETEGGLQGSFDSTISYGIQVRAQKQASDNIGNDNGGNYPTSGALGERLHGPGGGVASNPDFNILNADDGNLNYNRGDLTSAVLKGTHELGMKWGDGWRFLARGSWLYDTKVDNTRFIPLTSDAKELAARDVRLLDFWISKDFQLVGSQPATLKLGNQVISWGEDIFIVGGVNSINAIDLRRFHTPGTQLKEVFRPAPMLYLNAGVTDTLNLEAYYQFRWNGFQFDPVGTFFSGADVVGKGQRPLFAPSSFGLCGSTAPFTCGDGLRTPPIPGANVIPIERPDVTPPNLRQYGMALRLKPRSIDTEFAFYYIRYHDKLPFTSYTFDANNSSLVNPASTANLLGVSYFNEYGKDKNLFGVSMNTKVGPVAVGAELSYRPRESVAIDATVPVPAGLAAAFGFPFTGLTPGSKALQYSVLDAVSCGLGTGDAVTPGPVKSFDAATCRTSVRGYVEEKKWQAHLTGFYFIEVNSPLGQVMKGLGAAEGYVLAEAAVTHFPKLDTANVPYLIFPSYELPSKTSWGYVVEAALTYPNAIMGINVTPQIDFTHDVNGISPNTIPFVEGRKSLFVGLNFDRRSVWRGQIGYSTYWGGGISNILRDRDFYSASLSYSF